MEIEFDPTKDAANIAKHGLSLAEAGHFDFAKAIVVEDSRMNYHEARFRAFARIDGQGRCLVFTAVSETTIRAISYRRAHNKEMRRYGL